MRYRSFIRLSVLLFSPLLVAPLVLGSVASAEEYANFNLSTYRVGQVREKDYFFGCIKKDAAIQIVRWTNGLPSSVDDIMGKPDEFDKYSKLNGCFYLSDNINVKEILYIADQDRTEKAVGKDGKTYDVTIASSLLRVESFDGITVYATINALVEGTPTQQQHIGSPELAK